MLTQKICLDEQETQFCSPDKMASNSFQKETFTSNHLYLEKAVSPTEMSQTEADLYSREIVKNLIQINKNSTIRHEINQISKDCNLYAKPIRYNSKEFQFNHIPPHNQNYASSCSAKIKQIDRGMRNKSDFTDSTYKQKQRLNPQNSPQKSQSRISVSGLVTCKFQSVNAQRSLGFNQIDHQEKMKAYIRASQKMALCSSNRFKIILQKNSQNRYKEQQRKDRSINSNFNLTTSHYLKTHEKEEKQEMLIYGEKAKKLNFIKEYMSSEKTNYEQGRHIINQIENLQSKSNSPQKKVCKTQVDEELLLKGRRMPVLKKKIKVRFLTFVD